MDINELRKKVSTVPLETDGHWHVMVGVFMTAALVCSLATAFASTPEWPTAGALLFLALGLVWGWAIERRSFGEHPPARKS